MPAKPRSSSHGSFRAAQFHSGDPYEVSDGRLIYCAPTGGGGSSSNRLGASVVGWDPAVTEAGVDTGYSPKPSMLRAPDVAVGNVPDKPGWVKGAPDLAIEYADTGQDEHELQRKIVDLLAAGTRHLWVVRLTGLRRVEIHEPHRKMRTALPGESLRAPGILKNPVQVEALYERDAAERATLTNLLQRRGYDDLDAVLAHGREQGREQGLEQGREQGLEQGELLAKRDVLRRVLKSRRLALTEKLAARIEACADVRKLDRWIDRALVASTLDEVFEKRAPRS